MNTASAPGENLDVRQTSKPEDWHPDTSKSLPLDKARHVLLDDIIALYTCEPTIERVKRYTPDCLYDDHFVYANNRYTNSSEISGMQLTKVQLQDGRLVVCSAEAL